jgi:secretion/DNA translocation related TadE-like protein
MAKLAEECGSGTILSAGALGILLLAGLFCLRWQLVVDASGQAATAAETAAIAAADALSGFRTGYPCDVAKRISQLNMVSVEECRIVGFDVYIRVRSKSLGMVHFASARAGQP